jgi:hypothetical protein
MRIIFVALALAGCESASSPLDGNSASCPMSEPADATTCNIQSLHCLYNYASVGCSCDEFFGRSGLTWGCSRSSCPTDAGCAD